MSERERAVVIVGMCRSGTSGVAGALAKLGTYFGEPENLYSGDSHNEGGYWEHKLVNAVNRRFQTSLNLTALDVDPIPSDWRERPMSASMVASAAELMSKHLSGHEVWGWKDPQASTLLPFVMDVFDRVKVSPTAVICVRNPIDVATSTEKRQGTPLAQTLGGWILNTLAAIRDAPRASRYVVMYASFLSDPRRSLAPIVEALGLKPNEAEWSAAIDWVQPGLSHGQDDRKAFEAYPAILRTSYDLCVEMAESPTQLNAGAFDCRVDELWAEWIAWRGFLSRPQFPEAKLGLSWMRGAERQILETTYRPTKSWQRLRATCGGPSGSRISIVLYPLPALVWIRSAIWRQGDSQFPAKLLPGRHGQLDEQNGIQRVWLTHGFEQIAVEAPAAAGFFDLELEVLVEANNLITGMAFQDLSKRAR